MLRGLINGWRAADPMVASGGYLRPGKSYAGSMVLAGFTAGCWWGALPVCVVDKASRPDETEIRKAEIAGREGYQRHPSCDAQATSAEDKIRIVLQGLRGEESVAELCRKCSGMQTNILRTPPASPGP